MNKIAVLCAQGLEDIVISDITSVGIATNIEKYPGIVILDFDGDLKGLLEIKTAEDIMLLLKELTGIKRYRYSLRKVRTQSSMTKIESKIELIATARKLLNKKFFVKASYIGRRDYTAGEIEEAAGEGIMALNLETGSDADLLFRIVLTKEINFFGLCLYDKPFDEKNKYLALPGSLKPSIANSMLKIAEVKQGDIIIDPMCGTGTIAIEAAKFGAKTIAGDIDKEKIEIAKKNNEFKIANVEFHVWDARKTGLKEKTVDKIVSNLPLGKQVAADEFDEPFVNDFLREMIRISKDNARFVFLTKHTLVIEPLLDKVKLRLEKKIKIVNSGLESDILIIDKA
jgi:tRNA (guanine6-N2)-methyltransferase